MNRIGRGLLRANPLVIIPAFGVMLVAALWGVVALEIDSTRRASEGRVFERSEALSRAFEAHTEKALRHIDAATRFIKYQFESGHAQVPLDEMARSGLLPTDVARVITLLGKDGRVVASTVSPVGMDFSYREHFRAHLERDDGELYVSQPFQSRVVDHVLISMSRRLNNPDGSFAGVVAINVLPSYFTNFYSEAEFGKHGVVVLMGEDGVVRARRSGSRLDAGTNVALPRLTAARRNSPIGIIRVVSLYDGVARIMAYRVMPGLPLVALAGLAEHEALADFDARRSLLLLAATLGALTLAAFFSLITAMVVQYKRRRMEAEEAQVMYRAASEGALDAFCVLRSVRDAAGEIVDFVYTDVNERGARMFDAGRSALLGRRLTTLLSPEPAGELLERYARVVRNQHAVEEEFELHGPGAVVRWLRQQMIPVGDGLTVSSRDVTEAREARQRLEYLANYDPLTGLPNRHLFVAHLREWVARCRRDDHAFALIVIDLDDFKRINDTLGHSAGDELLCDVAQRLAGCTSVGDLLCRLGGDEFTVLMQDGEGESSPEQLCTRVRLALSSPFALTHGTVTTTASIGVARFADRGDDAQTLLRHADLAMYRAKELGRNTFALYDDALSERVADRLRIEQRLRGAIARDELTLMYQPKFDLTTWRITGFEALLRWTDAELGAVSPAVFIPVAEATGMILPLGAWVLRRACAQLQQWNAAGVGPIRVAANISAQQLRGDLVCTVADTLAEFGIEPRQLELELTESAVMEDVASAQDKLQRLNELGVSVSIDDFGTGYSSLAYLKRFAVDTLKIDRSFVADITENQEASVIAAAIVTMAHALDVTVVAEGVETEAQAAFLLRLGCDEGQGYFFSRPVVAADVPGLLQAPPSKASARTSAPV